MVLTRARVGAVLAGLIVLFTAFSALRLGSLEREGPTHTDLSLRLNLGLRVGVLLEDESGCLGCQFSHLGQ